MGRRKWEKKRRKREAEIREKNRVENDQRRNEFFGRMRDAIDAFIREVDAGRLVDTPDTRQQFIEAHMLASIPVNHPLVAVMAPERIAAAELLAHRIAAQAHAAPICLAVEHEKPKERRITDFDLLSVSMVPGPGTSLGIRGVSYEHTDLTRPARSGEAAGAEKVADGVP